MQRSSCGRPRIHIRGRLRQQPNTDLPSRRDIPSGFRMLGIRGRRVQRIGRDRCHVQRQYSSMRQREPSHSSFLNTPTGKRSVKLTEVISWQKLELICHFNIFVSYFLLHFWNTFLPSLSSYSWQYFHFLWIAIMCCFLISKFAINRTLKISPHSLPRLFYQGI
jgi:hypothetical protein